MTKLAIVGGKLQGMEVAYLARKASIETVVIDRDPMAPALSLADEAIILDTVEEPRVAANIFKDCDAVLPANEDLSTLKGLTEMLTQMDIPFIFDLNAYEVSSSKIKSNDFMKSLDIPMPKPWPECGFPVVVKPSGESGSMGVSRAKNALELVKAKEKVLAIAGEPVIQEFVEGPSISVEVIANGTDAVSLVTTQIFLDDEYDCKMVGSPWKNLDPRVEGVIDEASIRIAKELHLRGIMDVEAIVCRGSPKVLEIDARMPSQTPSAVLHSHGINMVSMLTDMVVFDKLDRPNMTTTRAAYYEHVAVDNGVMRSCGEGVFSEVNDPKVITGLFGSDEMITDYEPGKRSWRAAIVSSGSTVRSASLKRKHVLNSIMETENIVSYIDPKPEVYS